MLQTDRRSITYNKHKSWHDTWILYLCTHNLLLYVLLMSHRWHSHSLLAVKPGCQSDSLSHKRKSSIMIIITSNPTKELILISTPLCAHKIYKQAGSPHSKRNAQRSKLHFPTHCTNSDRAKAQQQCKYILEPFQLPGVNVSVNVFNQFSADFHS